MNGMVTVISIQILVASVGVGLQWVGFGGSNCASVGGESFVSEKKTNVNCANLMMHRFVKIVLYLFNILHFYA